MSSFAERKATFILAPRPTGSRGRIVVATWKRVESQCPLPPRRTKESCPVPTRLVALDDGSDILLDRHFLVVGRHPACDARLESLRVSRHHCCLTCENGEVVVRDLGSTNGIRINGQRVEVGRLQPGDELSIAHVRFRVEDGPDHGQAIARRPPPGDLLSPNSRIVFISRN